MVRFAWVLGCALAAAGCADDRDGGLGDEGSPPYDDGADDGAGDGTGGGDGSGDDGSGDDGDSSGTGGDGGGSDDGGSGDTSGDGGDPGEPAGTCGEGGPKGQIIEVNLGSPERWYIIGAPNTDEPLPLVMAFHGDEGNPYNSTRYIWGSYWEDLADPGFIAVMTKCPGCESWYQGDTDANAAYVWDVLTDVSSQHNVDINQVYAVGYSGGSEFLSLHGWEFQGVFAAIQWTCGGNAYGPYTEPPRPDCKVRGRIVISADDFLWDGAQNLRQRLEQEGHEYEFVEAQCSGHCCDTPDHNVGAWAWFQNHTKCGGVVTGECAELEELP